MHSIKKLIIVLFIGFCYFLFISIFDLSIPCIFRKLTGFKCPGCGITTMALALSRFDIKGAYNANQFIFVTVPFIFFEMLFAEKLLKKKWNSVLLVLYIVAIVIFSVYRNIYLI